MEKILYSSKEEVEDKINFKHLGLRKWRWDLSTFYGKDWFCLSYHQKVHFESDEKWKIGNIYYEILLRPTYWKFGYNSYYYDGDHKSISLGPIHFNWGY